MSEEVKVKTLPELPFTSALQQNDLIWIHQPGDGTDRHTTIEGFLQNVETILPKTNTTFNIGSETKQFANVHSSHVTIGTAGSISEVDGVLQIPASAITGKLTIQGDLEVLGSTTNVSVETVNIQDNLIQINSEQEGIPPTTLISGIEINRGSESNYLFVFAEDSDTFRIGEDGNTQPVATREDTPINGGTAIWNDSEKRFDTSNDINANAASATKLETARTITLGEDAVGNVTFDGTSNVTLNVQIVDDSHIHDGRYYTQAESDARFVNVSVDDTIDADLVVNGTVTASTFIGDLSGNAASTTKLITERKIQISGDAIGSQFFDGTSDIDISVTVQDDSHEHESQYYNKALADARFVNVDGDAIEGNLNITDGVGDGTEGNVTAAKFIGPLEGNATTADAWRVARTITLGGDLTGSVVINGAADMILNAEVVSNSHDHDNQYYTKEQADARYLNIEATAGDAITGNLNIDGSITANQFIGPIEGNATSADKFSTPRSIGLSGDLSGQADFDGSGPISIVASVADNSHNHVSADLSDATPANTAGMVVKRDLNGDFTSRIINATTFIGALTGNVTGDIEGNVTGDVVGDLTGNADTATILQTARTLSLSSGVSGSVSFNGGSDVDITVTVDPDAHDHSNVHYLKSEVFTKTEMYANFYLNSQTYNKTEADNKFVDVTGDTISGDLTVSGALHANADSATKLATSRDLYFGGDIIGHNTGFDGTADHPLNATIFQASGNGGYFTVLAATQTTINSANVVISGNLTVNGTQTIVNTETLEIEDNLILINKNQTGTPPATLVSGLEIERGTNVNYRFVFDELTDTFRIGTFYSDAINDMQAVATREDNPTNGGVAVWNSSVSRFETRTDLSGVNAATATLADAATALASPQTITFSGGINGSFVVGDNGGNKGVAVTVNKVAAATAADTATMLATARNIALSGAVTGSVNFDGSGNVTLVTSFGTDMATQAELNAVNTALDGRITSNDGDIADNVLAIAGHETRLDNIDTPTTGRLALIETKNSDQDSTISANQTNISNLQTGKADKVHSHSNFNLGGEFAANQVLGGEFNIADGVITDISIVTKTASDFGAANAVHSHSTSDITGLNTAMLNLLMPIGFQYTEWYNKDGSNPALSRTPAQLWPSFGWTRIGEDPGSVGYEGDTATVWERTS